MVNAPFSFAGNELDEHKFKVEKPNGIANVSEDDAARERENIAREAKPSRFRRFMTRLFPCIYKRNE